MCEKTWHLTSLSKDLLFHKNLLCDTTIWLYVMLIFDIDTFGKSLWLYNFPREIPFSLYVECHYLQFVWSLEPFALKTNQQPTWMETTWIWKYCTLKKIHSSGFSKVSMSILRNSKHCILSPLGARTQRTYLGHFLDCRMLPTLPTTSCPHIRPWPTASCPHHHRIVCLTHVM